MAIQKQTIIFSSISSDEEMHGEVWNTWDPECQQPNKNCALCKSKNNNCIVFCWKIWKENKLLVSFLWARQAHFSTQPVNLMDGYAKRAIKWLKPQTLTRNERKRSALFIGNRTDFYLLSAYSFRVNEVRSCCICGSSVCSSHVFMKKFIALYFRFFCLSFVFACTLCHSFKCSVLFVCLYLFRCAFVFSCVCLAIAFAEL